MCVCVCVCVNQQGQELLADKYLDGRITLLVYKKTKITNWKSTVEDRLKRRVSVDKAKFLINKIAYWRRSILYCKELKNIIKWAKDGFPNRHTVSLPGKINVEKEVWHTPYIHLTPLLPMDSSDITSNWSYKNVSSIIK